MAHVRDWIGDPRSAAERADFNARLSELPHAYELLSPGNWEWHFEDPVKRSELTNATLPVGAGVEVMGLKVGLLR